MDSPYESLSHNASPLGQLSYEEGKAGGQEGEERRRVCGKFGPEELQALPERMKPQTQKGRYESLRTVIPTDPLVYLRSSSHEAEEIVESIRSYLSLTNEEAQKVKGEMNKYIQEMKRFITPTRPGSGEYERRGRAPCKGGAEGRDGKDGNHPVRAGRMVRLKEIQELQKVAKQVAEGKVWEREELAPRQELLSEPERLERREVIQIHQRVNLETRNIYNSCHGRDKV
eukprot:g73086.t1